MFQLNAFTKGGERAKKPRLKIPAQMKFDESGNKIEP